MRSSRPPPQRERSPPHPDRPPSSRLPTKPADNSANVKPARDAQHVSQMGKRSLRNATIPTKPAPEPSRLPAVSKRASVTPELGVSHARLPATSALRHNNTLSPAPPLRTPSLTSATSTLNSSRSNLLRRKPSTIEQYKRGEEGTTSATNPTGVQKSNINKEDAFDACVLGIALPQPEYELSAAIRAAASPSNVVYQDLRDLTPPVPNYAQSATPSTRYTDSPFSHVPTPSSASSYSPALVVAKPTATSRQRPQSPTRSRPPITRPATEKTEITRLGLPPVRESSTSSSNSTVKPCESQSGRSRKTGSAKHTVLEPKKPAPADPPQKSSRTKFGTDQSMRAKSSTSSTASVQVPPELAHLNVDPPPRLSRDKGAPPIRPSRDGTPALTGIDVPSPVVQSDLSPLYTTYHKRTPSQEAPTISTSPSLRTRLGFHSKGPPIQASPRIDSAISPPPASRGYNRGPPPDGPVSETSRLVRKDSPAVGSSPSKSPRFGFFSRKPKIDASKPTEKPTRPPSKGPAAGTGHEGYGRFSMQRRNSSTSSSAGYRSPSTESTASSLAKRQSTSRKSSGASKDGYELDEFLRDRLKPVILRGSGSTVSNPTSNSDVQTPSGPNSSHHSSLDSIPRPQLLPSAMDSTAGISPTKSSLAPRALVDSSEDDLTTRYPPAATSLTNPRNAPSTASRTGRTYTASSSDRYDSKPSMLPHPNTKLSKQRSVKDNDNPYLRPSSTEVEPKAPRKWNFFQRAQASPRGKSKIKAAVDPVQTSSAEQQARYLPTAHYAMLDPVESIGLEEVERIIQEAETSPEDSNSEMYAASRASSNEPQRRSLVPFPAASDYSDDSELHTRLLPPQIMVRQESQDSSQLMYAERTVPHRAPHVVDIRRSPSLAGPTTNLEQKAIMNELKPTAIQSHEEAHTPEIPQFDSVDSMGHISPPRPPRLSPIGRIPKVVSKRDRERKLSDSSFSRPFARGQPKPTVKPPGSLYNQIRDLASPIESNSQPVSSTSTTSNALSSEHKESVDINFRRLSTNRASVDAFERGDFFSFPSRKDSDVSYSSSSGNNSVLAILAAQPPQEDDIWNEYNDLLDAVLPEKAHYSYASSFGAPFQYSASLYDSPDFDSHGWYPPQPPSLDLPVPPRSQVVPTILSVPQQIARMMQPSFSPLTTPQALSEVFSDYGRRSTSTLMSANWTSNIPDSTSTVPQSRSTILGPKKASSSATERTIVLESARTSLPRSSKSSSGAQNRSSLPRSTRSSIPSIASTARHSRGSAHSRSASLPEANVRNSQSSLAPSVRLNRDTQLLDIAEVDGDEQAAAASLRFGALMTSKWLSFGRVLFSPAHKELRGADDGRVLIIDGMGSDWSYYVAISYPTATIYNLGSPPVKGVSDWPGVNEKPPSNHRHINHAAISAAFPFPKGFFTAVVFRFPLATTDQAYQACIHECKRVLRPGGYIEVAALDLDLMNMGNKARKELRGLKTRLQQQRQDISLRNLSDMLVGLIGRRGFEDIQRCFVGVPAAGHIPKSQDISSVSSKASGKHAWQREDRQSREFSFADLLDDARANQLDQERRSSDENITKMVAKVARWWYTTCYEKALFRTDDSIWNDTALLRECEKQGTSFRLLLCCAQKPAQTRRRTVSV